MSSTAAPAEVTGGAGGNVLAVLQRVGRSLIMPIVVLPPAALLLRLGQPDLLGRSELGWLDAIADVISASGQAVFDALPLLFAVGVAIGFARRSDGSTALAALVGYLVFDRVTRVVFASVPAGWPKPFQALKERVVTDIDGTQTLDLAQANPTGVLGGILIGLLAAVLWQRYHRVQLPIWLAFFGGRRFVPIVTAFAALVAAVAVALLWFLAGAGIDWVGDQLVGAGALGVGGYGVVNRLLIPLGLHHIVNSIVWFTVPDCSDAAGTTLGGDLNCYFAGVDGTGGFMAGFFPVMMFGLPAAALAMVHQARAPRRKAVAGIMLAAGLTSLVTGVTEPIEFAFIFVAPVLFAVHAVLTGVSMALAYVLDIKIGFGFSAGLIDYVLNFNKANTENPLLVIVLGVIYAIVYYLLFRVLIRTLDLKTPGREPEEEPVSATPG
ncbi:MAG TPA: PTS transporter subunit EIIC [Pseudonocardiaceae bacterium]|nr:PTS transporter subunit EIIC [Pseudonocardiaceae bacterium]